LDQKNNIQITIALTGASVEQKARFQGEAFTQTIASVRDAAGDVTATVEVHCATPYVSYMWFRTLHESTVPLLTAAAYKPVKQEKDD